MPTRPRVLVGLAFGTLVVGAVVAPFFLMLLPNPVPVRVQDMSSQAPGAFIATRGAVYRVFPRAERASTLPTGSLVTDERPTLWIRYRQLDQLESYSVHALDGAPIAVDRDRSQPNLLRIQPKHALDPGGYYAEVARDGVDGGTDYVYFHVAATLSAAGADTPDPQLDVAPPVHDGE
jgi:hypothetical protein